MLTTRLDKTTQDAFIKHCKELGVSGQVVLENFVTDFVLYNSKDRTPVPYIDALTECCKTLHLRKVNEARAKVARYHDNKRKERLESSKKKNSEFKQKNSKSKKEVNDKC